MEKTDTSIHGIVIPHDWDENGNVLGIKILGFDEAQYELEENTASKNLIPHVRRTVTVYGSLIETDHLKKIRVDNFCLDDMENAGQISEKL